MFNFVANFSQCLLGGMLAVEAVDELDGDPTLMRRTATASKTKIPAFGADVGDVAGNVRFKLRDFFLDFLYNAI